MPHIQLSQNKKIEIKAEDVERIKDILISEDQPRFIEVEGQMIKTASIMGVFKEDEDKSYTPSYMDYQWGDDELTQWEKKIFEHHDTFRDYIISEGVVNTEGAIKDTNQYRMFIAKWNRLNELRSKREEVNGFIGRNKWLKEMKIKVIQLAQSKSIRIEKPAEPCQSTEEPKEGEIEVDKIPFG